MAEAVCPTCFYAWAYDGVRDVFSCPTCQTVKEMAPYPWQPGCLCWVAEHETYRQTWRLRCPVHTPVKYWDGLPEPWQQAQRALSDTLRDVQHV